jgi:hypothetical protein
VIALNQARFAGVFQTVHLDLMRGQSVEEICSNPALRMKLDNIFARLVGTRVMNDNATQYRISEWVPDWNNSSELYHFADIYLHHDTRPCSHGLSLSKHQELSYRIVLAALLIATKKEDERMCISEFLRHLIYQIIVVSVIDPGEFETLNGTVDYNIFGLMLANMPTIVELRELKREDFDVAFTALLRVLGGEVSA